MALIITKGTVLFMVLVGAHLHSAKATVIHGSLAHAVGRSSQAWRAQTLTEGIGLCRLIIGPALLVAHVADLLLLSCTVHMTAVSEIALRLITNSRLVGLLSHRTILHTVRAETRVALLARRVAS
jgi:hypothetical protein